MQRTRPGGASGTASPNYKSGSLLHTKNFTWNTADALGRGATAIVYFGRHKESGDVCAVKVFHDRLSRYMTTTREREIESFRNLKHKNIVKLISLEKEEISSNEVLIMEYCSGGSLHSMLDQPQYAYGFPETEFRLFLTDMANGMQYLKRSGYVHRDIKPGNIMRCIGDAGRSIYKLTDFGAARELQEDETFNSIYGTEEYLYPKMYEQAVLRRPGPQNFDASVDLWSLGVTIYHVAAGKLPFQPFGGRSNAATMHFITSSKPKGAISGIQSAYDGPIAWENALPRTCQLSRQMKSIMEPMLAGLMEIDLNQMWTFDRFFNTVTQLDAMIVFKVFVCCAAEHILIYVNQTDSYTNIQERIAEATDIPAGNQLILWHDKQLSDVVDIGAAAHTYAASISIARFYVINKLSMETGVLKIIHIPPFPDITLTENLEGDARTSKKAAAVANLMCICIKMFLDQQSHIYKGELLFRRYLKRIVWHSEWIVPEIRRTLNETQKRQVSFCKSFTVLLNLFKTLDSTLHVEELLVSKVGVDVQIRQTVKQLSECLDDKSLHKFQEKISRRLQEIVVYVEMLGKRIAEQEAERMRQSYGCSEDEYCLSKAEYLQQKILAVHSTMSKHKKYNDLHPHEQFIHKCEKEKLQEHCVAMMSLAQDHCKRNLQQCFKAGQREFCNLTKHLIRTKKVEQNITSVKDSLEKLSENLNDKEVKCRSIVEKITSLLEATLRERKTSQNPGPSVHHTLIPAVGKPRMPAPSLKGKEVRGSPIPGEVIRSELPSRESMSSGNDSSDKEGASRPKRQRTVLLDKLASELMSLQDDSDELKHLVLESSEVMNQFLTETSNLHIEGSLDSDQRRFQQDDT